MIYPSDAIWADEDTIEELDEVKKPLSVNCCVDEKYELVLDCSAVIAFWLLVPWASVESSLESSAAKILFQNKWN